MRHRTKTVKDTQRAMTSELPLFQDMVNKGCYNPVIKPAEKIVTKSPTPARTGPYGLLPYQNCDKPGHGWRDCPEKDKCLKCKTAAHKYWDWGTCLHRKSVLDGRNKRGSSVKAMAAKVAADENAAMRLELAQLKAAMALKVTKPIILDSGANVCIISDITHVDTNTVPLCRRAEEASEMDTAVGTVMLITGT